MIAANEGHEEVVEVLLTTGADVDEQGLVSYSLSIFLGTRCIVWCSF